MRVKAGNVGSGEVDPRQRTRVGLNVRRGLSASQSSGSVGGNTFKGTHAPPLRPFKPRELFNRRRTPEKQDDLSYKTPGASHIFQKVYISPKIKTFFLNEKCKI